MPVAGDWNGRDLVTLDDLHQIYGDLRNEKEIAAGLPFLNAAMLQAGTTTPARKAAFLATVRNESGFRADAVEPGHGRYRGRGFIQLTGESNYRRAGRDLGLDLADDPSLAANPLVSAAVAAWYWTVARDINRAADWLDMAAVDIAVGYRQTNREDAERCLDFTAALAYFSGGQAPEGVNCRRTILSQLLGLAAIVAPSVNASTDGSGTGGPAQRSTVPWPLEAVLPTPPSLQEGPDRPPRSPSTRPPSGGSTTPASPTTTTTAPTTTRPPTPTTGTTTTTAPSTTTTTTPTTTPTTAPPDTTTTTQPWTTTPLETTTTTTTTAPPDTTTTAPPSTTDTTTPPP
jgi:predicted chitinase